MTLLETEIWFAAVHQSKLTWRVNKFQTADLRLQITENPFSIKSERVFLFYRNSKENKKIDSVFPKEWLLLPPNSDKEEKQRFMFFDLKRLEKRLYTKNDKISH
jgi:hypothetical protein